MTNAAIDRVTQQYRRELAQLQELLEQRLGAMDKATELLASQVGQVPSETDNAVHALRELIEARIDAMDEATKLLATNVDKVPYAILQEAGNLRSYILSRIEDVTHVTDAKLAAIDERYAVQTKTLDVSFAAAEEAVKTALASAEKAVEKAETATEARFAGVNEFRQALTDQAGTFLPRAEYTTAHAAVVDSVSELRASLVSVNQLVVPRTETDAWRQALIAKVDEGLKQASERLSALELRLTSRLDLSAGAGSGAADQRGEIRADRAGTSQVIIMVVMALSVVIAIVSVIAFVYKK